MGHYNVSFFRDLLSSDGHTFKCVQRMIAVEAESPNEAINAAKQQFEDHCSVDDRRLYAEAVECATKPPPIMLKAIQRPVTRAAMREKQS